MKVWAVLGTLIIAAGVSACGFLLIGGFRNATVAFDQQFKKEFGISCPQNQGEREAARSVVSKKLDIDWDLLASKRDAIAMVELKLGQGKEFNTMSPADYQALQQKKFSLIREWEKARKIGKEDCSLAAVIYPRSPYIEGYHHHLPLCDSISNSYLDD